MLQSSVVVKALKLTKAGKAAEFVGAQVSAALAGLTAEQVDSSTVIAYEPIQKRSVLVNQLHKTTHKKCVKSCS